jgi:hypothetical protein
MKRLALRWPIGRTWLTAAAWLAALCLAAELLARLPAARRLFPVVSYGSTHAHFNTQVSRILARTAAQGQLDCIFIGDSQVIHGINPAVIEPLLSEGLGKPVRCQNFGLGGMTPLSVEPVARMLIARFHPALLVFGTSEMNYIASSMDASQASILSSPWLAYELGEPSVDGWLLENSYVYRTYLGTLGRLFGSAELNEDIQPDGHSTKFTSHTKMSLEEQLDYFGDFYSKAVLSPPHVEGLQRLLALNEPGTRLIVVEMPIDPAYFEHNRGLRRLNPEYREMLVSTTSAAGTPLYLTQDSIHIPADGWQDLIHFNTAGRVFFSRYLVDVLASNLGAPVQTSP